MSLGYYRALMGGQVSDEYPYQVYDDLHLWLDFSDSSYLTLSGTDITQANDRSSQSNNAPQRLGANAPTFVSNSQNSLGVADFSGDDLDALETDSGVDFSSGEVSVYILVKLNDYPPTTSARRTGLWVFGNQSGHYSFTDGNIYEYFSTTVRKTISGFSEDLSDWNVYHVESEAGNFKAYLNNNLIYSTTSNSLVSSPQLFLLGSSVPSLTSTGRNLDGQVGEALILDRILTSTERGDMVSYLQNKWNI